MAFDCFVFSSSWVTLCDHTEIIEAFVVINLRVLKLVLSFHMTLFHYGGKGVRDIDRTGRCRQSNIMPDNKFSVNITQCITCGCCVFVCMCVCVSLGVIFWTPFNRREKVLSFFPIKLVGFGKP